MRRFPRLGAEAPGLIPLTDLGVFFAAAILLALAPGPDNIFVLTQAALRGRAAGWMVTLGLCTGLVAHTLAVALGVAALVKASSVAFSVLKSIGAGYLLYLAWGAWRAGSTSMQAGGAASLGWGKLYRRGIVMNVSNPKVTIFFLAFLPQFADPARGPLAPQLVLLGGVFMLATLLVFGGVAMLAGWLGQRLSRSERAQRLLNRVAAVLFAGLAIKLALAER